MRRVALTDAFLLFPPQPSTLTPQPSTLHPPRRYHQALHLRRDRVLRPLASARALECLGVGPAGYLRCLGGVREVVVDGVQQLVLQHRDAAIRVIPIYRTVLICAARVACGR